MKKIIALACLLCSVAASAEECRYYYKIDNKAEFLNVQLPFETENTIFEVAGTDGNEGSDCNVVCAHDGIPFDTASTRGKKTGVGIIVVRNAGGVDEWMIVKNDKNIAELSIKTGTGFTLWGNDGDALVCK